MKRQTEATLKIRILGTAALAQLYYLQNHRYPSDPNDMDVGKMRYILENPATSSSWKYRVYAEGDSCEIDSAHPLTLLPITLGPPK